jgi:hypothetical protein
MDNPNISYSDATLEESFRNRFSPSAPICWEEETTGEELTFDLPEELDALDAEDPFAGFDSEPNFLLN